MVTKPRLNAELENFHTTELDCKCGCGKKTHPKMAVCLQAFIYYLEAHYKTAIRCIVHSPARCKADHARIKGKPGGTSFHMGLSRLDEGSGAALDVHFEALIVGKHSKKWIKLNKHDVANLAIKSKLFGGVGWMIYPAHWNMIHLDIGPVRKW